MTTHSKICTVITLLVTLAFLYAFVEQCKAQDQTALLLAQCLRAEADTYYPDYAPIAHVLKKRAEQRGVSLRVMILDYCAVFDKRSVQHYRRRARAILASTVTSPKHGTKKEWMMLYEFVAHFVDGLIPDPCPKAMHWGGKIDVVWPGLIEVCPELGKRGNRFYRVRGDR